MCDQIPCDDLCTELMQAADRIKASGNAELDDAHESLYRSWVGRLSALQSQPTPSNIRKLTSAICQGPWTPSQQDELIGIITSIKEKRAKKQARRKSQTCLNFENMISADCYVKLKDTERFSQKSRLSIMASCARAVNLVNPCEKTRFHMVKLLAYCEDNWEMTQKEVLELMDKLRDYIHSGKPDRTLPYIEMYPSSANELPDMLKQRAFGNEAPVDVCMPDLEGVLSGRKKRGRDKDALDMSWMSQIPDAYRAQVAGIINKPSASTSHNANVKPQMPSINMFRYGIPMRPSEDNPGAYVKNELKHESVNIKSESVKHESGNIKSEPDGLAHGEDIDNADGTLAGLEDKLVNAYRKAQKALKQPKTAKAKTSAKVIKRPASAPMSVAPKSVVKKRPAGVQKPNLDMTHIFARLRNRKPLPGYASFTSCAYHPARNLALKAGYSEAEAKEIGRKAFEKAAKLHAPLS